MKLPPHPKYKPSGVVWLGDVPEHWEIMRLSYMALLKSGENITSEMIAEDGDYPVYGGNGLRGNYQKFTHRGHHALIGRQGALCGNINYASGEFYASEHALVVLPLKEFSVVWMGELLRAMNLGQYSVTAAQPGIAAEMIRGLRIPVPTVPEQRAIAAYLDRETNRIDLLVAKKRELIERLKEKRTALISRTVTKGLPPAAAKAAGLPVNPKMRDSGIEWLGDIPEHWRVMRFRRLILRLDQGWSPNANNYPAAPDELGVLKLGAASKGKFYPDDNKALDEIPEGVIPITPASDDLLISRANTPDLVGDACVVKGNYPNRIIPDLLYRLRLRADANGDFVCWFLLSRLGRAQIGCDARGSNGSMVKLGQGHVRAWSLPFPPLPEQHAIAAYLDAETAKLDALVAKVEEAVERLQEYRTALITAAVAGKIDVRNRIPSIQP